jgi:hypothetical protein
VPCYESTLFRMNSGANQRAPLDAGSATSYISGVIGPARVSAGRWASC